jgi:hypothetical protein
MLGVLMRIRSVAIALGALALVAVLGLITPADAGNGNYVVVEKVVDGPVPEGTVFEIEVDCTPSAPVGSPEVEATPSVPDPPPVTLKFDANGDPLGTDMVSAPPFGTCKVTETDDGGASTVSYKCAVPPLPNGIADPQASVVQVECLDDQTVAFGQMVDAEETAVYDVIGAEGTVTVTNTFEPEPEPEAEAAPDSVARQPSVVAARPTFTG